MSLDPDGVELADDRAAYRHAIACSGEHMTRHAADFWEQRSWRMLVVNARGGVVFDLQITMSIGESSAQKRSSSLNLRRYL